MSDEHRAAGSSFSAIRPCSFDRRIETSDSFALEFPSRHGPTFEVAASRSLVLAEVFVPGLRDFIDPGVDRYRADAEEFTSLDRLDLCAHDHPGARLATLAKR